MRILIFEKKKRAGLIWKRFLARNGHLVELCSEINEAVGFLALGNFDVFIIDASDNMEAAATLTDLASYQNPDISNIVVTSGRFFADSSIFKLIPNVRGCVSSLIEPNDLLAIMEHYTTRGRVDPGREALPNLLMG